MPPDHSPQQRRGHFHRSRRGPDRRGPDRRGPQPPPAERAVPSDHVDVEAIMRDIRARIAQRGIELSQQQIQELAARRLESILDPRGIKPGLLEQLRKSAGTVAAPDLPSSETPSLFTFEENTLYESHRAILRFMRRLLNPVLKLFFNPNPLVQALNAQSQLNRQTAAREAERERTQAEWNGLHYEILQRMVTETSRVTLELQSLSGRVESLATKVDFSDRRVRTLEGTGSQARPPRPQEMGSAPGPQPVATMSGEPAVDQSGDINRRRRRRRRGRRPGMAGSESTPSMIGSTPVVVESQGDGGESQNANAGASPLAEGEVRRDGPDETETVTPTYLEQPKTDRRMSSDGLPDLPPDEQ